MSLGARLREFNGSPLVVAPPRSPSLARAGAGTVRFRHRRWAWLSRNAWRVGPALAAVGVMWAVEVPRLPGLGELLRAVGNLAWGWVAAWPGAHAALAAQAPWGPSPFDACWAGHPGPCHPGGELVAETARLAVTSAGVVALWWRFSEFPTEATERRWAWWFRARRRDRVLGHLAQQWDAALGAIAGLHPDGRPLGRLQDLRVDASGNVVGDLKLVELADAHLLNERNLTRIRSALEFSCGYRRRFSTPLTRPQPGWGRPHRCWHRVWQRGLRALATGAAFVSGDGRYSLYPAAINLGEHPSKGGRFRRVRFVFPALGQELLEPDTSLAPDASRVRLGLGEEVVHWNRITHPHLLIVGATGRGKGHVRRRVAWQCLANGELVVAIDGQMGHEDAVFRNLPNFWWFDPESVDERTIPEWALASLTDDQRAEIANGDIAQEQYIDIAHLCYVRQQLRSVIAMGRKRARLVRREKVDGWHQLSPALQRAHPRIDVLTDELNTLLMKGATGGPKVIENLRRDIGALIGVILFGGRKYGVHLIGTAQILYAASFMAKGAYAQFGFGVAVGALPATHQRMVSAVENWPKVANLAGFGATFAYAVEPVTPVRLPALPTWVAENLAEDLLARSVTCDAAA